MTKTGADHLKSLDDGREVFINGERIADPINHPAFKNAIRSAVVAIPAYKLVIEIDGGHHATTVEADEERTRDLNAHGYRVIRFWNNDVLGNLEGVLETIVAEIDKSPTSP